jgi:hypothetical protein
MTSIKSVILTATILTGNLAPLALFAETAPIEAVATQAYPTDIFYSKFGFYYVLDIKPGIAWIIAEDGTFETLAAFSKVDDVFSVIRNGEWAFDIPVGTEIIQTQYIGLDESSFPSTRPFLQQIIGQELVDPLGDFIPAGARFETEFTMSTPQGDYFIWYPEDRGRGLFITNLATNDKRYVPFVNLIEAVGWSE